MRMRMSHRLVFLLVAVSGIISGCEGQRRVTPASRDRDRDRDRGREQPRGSRSECDGDLKTVHLGGIFQDPAAAAYFNEAVIRANRVHRRLFPPGFCLAPAAMVLETQGSLMQLQSICDELMKYQLYMMFLGRISSETAYELPNAASYISSYYQIPTLSAVGQVDKVITANEVHTSIIRLLPHKAHEVEVWCALLTYLQLTHAVMMVPEDAVGTEYEVRMRKCWWRGNTIRYIQFVHWDAHVKPEELARLVESVKYDNYRVVLLYAEQRQASIVLEEARYNDMTGPDWLWIVSQYVAEGTEVPVGSLVTRFEPPSERELIDEAVNIASHLLGNMLNTTWRNHSMFLKSQPPKSCIQAADNKWEPEGRRMSEQLKRAFYLNFTRHSAVAFDAIGYRKIARYSIQNVQSPGEIVTVGEYNEMKKYFDEDMDSYVESTAAAVAASRSGRPAKRYDFGVYFSTNARLKLNDPAHTNDAKTDSTMHSFVETVQNKVDKISREVSDYFTQVKPLTLDESAIVWPNGTKPIVPPFVWRWHLRVVTIEAVPFVYVFRNPQNRSMTFRDHIGATSDTNTTECITDFAVVADCSNVSTNTVLTKHDNIDENLVANETNEPIVCHGLRCTYSPANSSETYEYCCFGFCIDLLIKLSRAVNITFDLHLVKDGGFGHRSEDMDDGSGQVQTDGSESSISDNPRSESWTGMIGELERDEADMIVAPLTVLPERNRVVDFTKPFMYPTLSIITRRSRASATLGSFLYPFETDLWFSIFGIVNGVAFLMYFIERYSPFGWYRYGASRSQSGRFESGIRRLAAYAMRTLKSFSQRRPKDEDKTDKPITLAEAVWLSWGIMLSTGPGEQLPRSSSTRVFTMVFACFSMIVVASYTANLAAFLVLDRPEDVLNGIDDPRLRNPSSQFMFSTVRNSDVASYFKRNVELSTMYRFMESYLFDSVEEAIEAVRNGSRQAFIWETSRLLHETTMDCRLVLATGGVFGKSRYALALRPQLKNFVHYDGRLSSVGNMSYASGSSQGKAFESAARKQDSLVDKMSIEIIKMHDVGLFEILEEKWILSSLESIGIQQEIIESVKASNPYAENLDLMPHETACGPASTSGNLNSILGIFYLLIWGVFIAAIILVFEVSYYRCRRMKDC